MKDEEVWKMPLVDFATAAARQIVRSSSKLVGTDKALVFRHRVDQRREIYLYDQARGQILPHTVRVRVTVECGPATPGES